MSTVLLTSAGGLPQVSVIKHLWTLPEVTRIVGYDRDGYFGAAAGLLDEMTSNIDYPSDAVLLCGDDDVVKRGFAQVLRTSGRLQGEISLGWATLKPEMAYRLRSRGVPIPEFVSRPWIKDIQSSGSRSGVAYDISIAQERLHGTDWSVDVFVNGGTAIAVARKRLRAKGASVHGIVKIDNLVEDIAVMAAWALDAPGLFNVQMMGDEAPKVYEVNPRISGSIMLSVYAGVDLLRMEIRRQLGLSLEGLNTVPRDGATMHRYYSETFSG